MKQPKGNLLFFLSFPPELDVWLFPTDVPISKQRVGTWAGSILLLLLLGMGKTEAESAGDGSSEGCWRDWGLSLPETIQPLECRILLSWCGWNCLLESCFPSAARERRLHTTALKGAAGLKQVPAGHLCSIYCNKDDSEVY